MVQVPIPDHMDIYHLHQEAEPSDRTALQAVVDHIEAEVARLNALEEHIMMEYGPEDERLQVLPARLQYVSGSSTLAEPLPGVSMSMPMPGLCLYSAHNLDHRCYPVVRLSERL